MELMCWSEKFSVGTQDIDAQHHLLVDTLNELYEAIMTGGGKELTEPMLRNLLAFTCDHFAAEERLLANAGCESLETHCARHRELTRKIEIYLQRFERGEIALHMHLMNFLRDWLRMHIDRVDRAFEPGHAAHPKCTVTPFPGLRMPGRQASKES